MVTTEEVNQLYTALLGRTGQQEYLQRWADSGMSLPEIHDAIQASPEGQAYAASQASAPTPTPTPSTAPVTAAEVQNLYAELLGRSGAPEYVQQFVDTGMTADQIREQIMQSPEYTRVQESIANIQSGIGNTTNVDAATNAINLMFNTYGGRPPSQAELDQFLGVYGQVGAMNMANQIQNYFGTGTGTFTDDPTGSQMSPVTAEQVQGLYQNLLGRAGADQYVMQFVNSGMTLDQIRQEMMRSAEYQNLQNQGGGGVGGAGGAGGTGGGDGTTGNPYTDQFNAMQAEISALREQLASLSSMGQPNRGTAGTGTGEGGGVQGDVYTSAGAYTAQPAFNPYRTQPTPEMLDAYRFQQFQSAAPSLVPTPASQANQGQGSATGYFGYDPRNVQAILSGF